MSNTQTDYIGENKGIHNIKQKNQKNQAAGRRGRGGLRRRQPWEYRLIVFNAHNIDDDHI
jgi:hypothetical protein